ncbi:ArsR/SmtB family transcription factor [Naasia lichenicola]|nr:metalloregulator ArsR/SmtB family transcription factor [Naasia lichenicola]
MPEDDDLVFKALADPTRRSILDRLFLTDGLSVSELERELPMSRFGVAKHLRVLEEANLITVRTVGRERRSHLNRIPIRQIHDRWIDKYTEPATAALVRLKRQLEEDS